MRTLTELEKAECQAMTDAYAKKLKTRTKTEAAGASAMTFSGQVNFSDTCPDDKADFFAPEKQETAFNDIKRLTVVHSVKDSIKQFLTKRNEVIRRNKERKAEAQKAFSNRA